MDSSYSIGLPSSTATQNKLIPSTWQLLKSKESLTPQKGARVSREEKENETHININISSENHKTITRLRWKQTSGAPSTPLYLSFIATYVSSHKSCFNFFLKQSHYSSTDMVTCNFYKSMCHIKLCYFQKNYGWKWFFFN